MFANKVPDYKFAAASATEQTVFGARRPSYRLLRGGKVPQSHVDEWIAFMQAHDIRRVVCLLSEGEVQGKYEHLLEEYRAAFGDANVCAAPIQDFHLADEHLLLDTILPFLVEADQQGEKVVVHCAGGIGRTGHVLAAWLVYARGMSNEKAIAAVTATGRNPCESRDKRLDALLNACRTMG